MQENIYGTWVFKNPKIMSKSCVRRKEMLMVKRGKVLTFHV